MKLGCFCCGELFNRDCSEEEAERIQFCGDVCKNIFKDWCARYDEISLTRYYLIRKHTHTKNGRDVFE